MSLAFVSNTQSSQPSENKVNEISRPRLNITDWAFLIALASLAPMLWIQCLSLWSRPHFQFFPMAWLGFGYFVHERLGSPSPYRSQIRLVSGVAIAIFCLLASAESVFISSPWLAYASAVGLVVSWLLLRGNKLRWHTAVGLSSVLWMTVPFPAGYDNKLIQFLQRQSSFLTSVILDCIGIFHLPEGNVLELAQKRLFVDEACSGVDSLYALMAICLCLVLWFKQRLFVAIVSLSLVPVWASCGNIVRLVTIVLGLEWIGIDLSHGVQHTILGLLVFAGAFSCDYAFIQFAGAVFRKKSSSSFRECTTAAASNPPVQQSGVLHVIASSMFVMLFLAIGAYSFQILTAHTLQSYPTFDKLSLARVKDSQNLPKVLGDWQFESVQSIERSRESSQGQFSNVWMYRSPIGPVMISTDFPFRGFHLLDICYEGAGWRLNSSSRQVEQSSGASLNDRNEKFYAHILDMTNDEGRFAYVVYALFRLDGTSIQSAAKGVRGLERFEQTVLEPVSFQIQVMLDSNEAIEPDKRDAVHRNLEIVVAKLRTTFRELKFSDTGKSSRSTQRQ